MARDWQEGSLVGPYRIEGHLGAGGMGTVHRVRHQETGAHYAMKSLTSLDPEDHARFAHEIEAMAAVDGHPNVIRIHATGTHLGRPYLIMELAEGGDLESRLCSGPMESRAGATLVRALAEGVAHLHGSGILHRDLKPANVLFDANDTPKLVDFGLARIAAAERLTRTGDVMGTPAFMAPEQALGDNAAIGERTDVYGLGAVLYRCLTGRPPVTGAGTFAVLEAAVVQVPPRPSSLVDTIEQSLDRIVLKALAKDQESRHASARALGAALDAYLRGEDSQGRRLRSSVLLAALAALLLGVALLWGLWPSPSIPPETPEPAPAPPSDTGGAGDVDQDPQPPTRSRGLERVASLRHDDCRGLAFLPDGSVITGGRGLKLWDSKDWTSAEPLSLELVTSLVPLPTLNLLAVGVSKGNAGELVLRRLDEPAEVVRTIPLEIQPLLACFVLFGARPTILVCGQGNDSWLIPLAGEAGETTSPTRLPTQNVNALCVSSDGSKVLLLAGSDPNNKPGVRSLARLELWDLSRAPLRRVGPKMLSSRPNAACSLPDGGWVVGATSGQVTRYDSLLAPVGEPWVAHPFAPGSDSERYLGGGGWPVLVLQLLEDGRLVTGSGGYRYVEADALAVLQPADDGVGWDRPVRQALGPTPVERSLGHQSSVSEDGSLLAIVVAGQRPSTARQVELWSLPTPGR